MARSLHWMEKVARNVVLPVLLSTIIILTLINVPAAAQTSRVKNSITFSCRAARLESVIEYLSKNTGYDFIYSRDLVDISRPVSFTVKDKSINEVLGLIERQVSVTFKIQDRHIIVKTNPRPAVVSNQPKEKAIVKVSSPSFKTSDSLLMSSVSRSIPVPPHESHADLLQDHLDRRINELQALLGPGVPRNISPFYISQINFNNRHRGWFASVGTYVGDNSSGLELQAGLPYLYAVVHPRWTFGQGFTGAYGVGNSFNLTGNFSFNGMYMFSGRTKTESSFPMSTLTTQIGPEVRRSETVRLHQIKMAVQYHFSKTLSVRAGPVLNYRNTTRELSIITTNAYPESYGYRQESVYGNTGNVVVVYKNGQPVSAYRATRTTESWIGWEASLTYRINFFPRR